MASSSPWDPVPAAALKILHHPIHQGGSRMTWFYALWVYHKGDGWTVWLGCPKDKIVRLVRLFRRHHDIGLPDAPWTAPVIPVARVHQTCSAAAQAATLIPADTGPAPSGALAFQRLRHPGAPEALHPDEG